MSDSVSSYYEDLAQKYVLEQAEREKTLEYWREKAERLERELDQLKAAIRLLKSVS